MRKIERLRLRALEACRRRGHTMGRFRTHDFWTKQRYARCRICDKQVVINGYPALNETDISGWAIALECGDDDPFSVARHRER